MLLEQLSNAFGVSSAEDEVRNLIIEAVKPHADSWRIDTMGNLFVERKAASSNGASPRRVMITAHMDEVGFMISKINSNGRLKFSAVGGFDPRVLLGKTVMVGKNKVSGVIGLKPIHLLGRGEYDRVGGIDSMYIDIGASNDSANGKASVGDLATFDTKFGYLGGEEEPSAETGLVKGKALDNRVGCAIVVELLKQAYPVDVVGVFTVQEEIGLRGARVAAYAAEPDLAFVMECTAADDIPPYDDEEPTEGIPRLGDGPAITVMDRSVITDRRLVDFLLAMAEEHNIPYQFKRPGIGGTDAGVIHRTREGVPTIVTSVPARYIHSPAAVMNLTDFHHTVKLMRSALEQVAGLDLA